MSKQRNETQKVIVGFDVVEVTGVGVRNADEANAAASPFVPFVALSNRTIIIDRSD